MEKHVNENPGKKDQMSSLTVGVKYSLWKQKIVCDLSIALK
jgi:hypothetical protein